MKKDTRGSGMIWAIAVIMVLSVIVAGALTFAYYNYHSTIENTKRVQLELDSKANIEAIVYTIEQGKELDTFIPADGTHKKELSLSTPTKSKVEVGYIERTKPKEIMIYLSLSYGNHKMEIKAYMDYINRKWQINHYDEGKVIS